MADIQPTIHPTSTQTTQPKRIRGDGRIYKRGDVFWCAFYCNGKQQRESTYTRDEKKAEKYLQKRREKARAHEMNPTANQFLSRRDNKRTVRDIMDALQRYFEADDRAFPPTVSNINRIKRDFGAWRATALTAKDVNEYIAERRKAGDAKASINRTTQLLLQAFKQAPLPIPGPEKIIKFSEKGNARKGFFTDPEIRRVMDNLPKDVADFTLFGWSTGMRKKEIASLKWTDLQDDCIVLREEEAKNGESRSIPLVGELAELIEGRKAARSFKRNGTVTFAAFIFHRDGQPILEFRKSWHTACVAAGVGKWVCPDCEADLREKGKCPKCLRAWKREDQKYSGKLFHDLRRSAVRDMINAGVLQADAMKISGHTTTSMFQRYNIRENDDLRRALERTAAHRKTGKENVVAMAAKAK